MMKSSHYRIERRLLTINICNIWLLFSLFVQILYQRSEKCKGNSSGLCFIKFKCRHEFGPKPFDFDMI